MGNTTSHATSRATFVLVSRTTMPRNEPLSPQDILELVKGEDFRAARRGRTLNFGDRRRMRAEPVAPVHERQRRRAIGQLVRPIECRVAASNDDHAFAAKTLRIGDDFLDPAAIPGCGAACGRRRGVKAPIPAAMTMARVGNRSDSDTTRSDRRSTRGP